MYIEVYTYTSTHIRHRHIHTYIDIYAHIHTYIVGKYAHMYIRIHTYMYLCIHIISSNVSWCILHTKPETLPSLHGESLCICIPYKPFCKAGYPCGWARLAKAIDNFPDLRFLCARILWEHRDIYITLCVCVCVCIYVCVCMYVWILSKGSIQCCAYLKKIKW